ncbi:SDR family NAD(P)-dependent oxidoreductase [Streptomyces sp. NPDC096311]|uniref:SDR family NAD(P)-dependent oxidoreductase n=1 Tax=Streptomyces sp. NPDC096311 TaxID=3366083 RepID=UPI0038078926
MADGPHNEAPGGASGSGERNAGYGLMRDRVALVTGSGRNLGRAIAIRLAKEGAAVVVNDVRSADAERTLKDIEVAGGRAIKTVADMSDPAAVEAVFAQAEREFGTVDALVNNAYARGPATAWGPFLSLDVEGWSGFTRTNLDLLFLATHRAATAMAAAGHGGTILNISSHGAARAHRNQIAYDSVKGAIESFTRATAVDLAPWGIRVNALRPGSVDVTEGTEGSDTVDPGLARLKATQIPLGRTGRPEDVAANVVALSCELTAYVTGQIYNVDGGMAVQARAPQVEIDTVWTPENIEGYGHDD